ncbi:hypothetical protein C0J52_24903, partial [Blattella germanica]
NVLHSDKRLAIIKEYALCERKTRGAGPTHNLLLSITMFIVLETLLSQFYSTFLTFGIPNIIETTSSKTIMSLQKGNKGDQPSGSILLTEDQAREYQYKVIYGWEPQRDVSKLKLGIYGRVSTYIPLVVLPTFASAILHQQVISLDVIIQKTPCPTCLQVRSALIQVSTSVLYPAILGPLASFSMASNYLTYRLPHLTEEPKAVFNLMKKMTKPIVNNLFSFAIAQGLIAMFITYMEVNSYYKVQEKLNALQGLNEELE